MLPNQVDSNSTSQNVIHTTTPFHPPENFSICTPPQPTQNLPTARAIPRYQEPAADRPAEAYSDSPRNPLNSLNQVITNHQ